MRSSYSCFLVAILLCLGCGPAVGSSYVMRPFEDSYADASLVAQVRLTSVERRGSKEHGCGAIYHATILHSYKTDWKRPAREESSVKFGYLSGLDIRHDHFIFLRYIEDPDNEVQRLLSSGINRTRQRVDRGVVSEFLRCNGGLPGYAFDDLEVIPVNQGRLMFVAYPYTNFPIEWRLHPDLKFIGTGQEAELKAYLDHLRDRNEWWDWLKSFL